MPAHDFLPIPCGFVAPPVWVPVLLYIFERPAAELADVELDPEVFGQFSFTASEGVVPTLVVTLAARGKRMRQIALPIKANPFGQGFIESAHPIDKLPALKGLVKLVYRSLSLPR